MIKIKRILRNPYRYEFEVQFDLIFGSESDKLPFLELSGIFVFEPDVEFDPEKDKEYIRNQIRKFIIANI